MILSSSEIVNKPRGLNLATKVHDTKFRFCEYRNSDCVNWHIFLINEYFFFAKCSPSSFISSLNMVLEFSGNCRSCHNEEEEETVYQFLCQCPGIMDIRERNMGKLVFV